MTRAFVLCSLFFVLLADCSIAGAEAARVFREGVQGGACVPAAPVSCGQVRLAGQLLADDGGRWTVRGVQFFLPQAGINGRGFHDSTYAGALADGSLVYWLDRAQSYLRANLLRIFVDLPRRQADGSVSTPTSHATLYDFALRAGARGMRLGLSLHNSADWTLTSERAGWISGLIDYFDARDALPLIAYLTADNEINNHCGRDGADCFDSTPDHNAQPYIDGAVDWTARFRALVKGRAPRLLVTVGISTEMADVDGTRGVFNFFRRDSYGRTLAQQVDFLAPHNYGGGAFGIIDDLRYNGYAGPVVLEEYGFPTDPAPRNRLWTEGPPACRLSPLRAECFGTAPYFVEYNLRALRERSYAGGVAWMLADMRDKDTPNACADPARTFDLWTGLFAIGGAYCDGGTYSRGAGQAKATALRVCVYHTGSVRACEPELAPFVAQLPLVLHSPPEPPRPWAYLPLVAR